MFRDTHIAMTAPPSQLVDFALIGEVGCGKTALMKALLNSNGEVLKTQAVVFHRDNVIDTPGEFVGRRSYFGALLATIVNVSTIVYLQVANNPLFSMPAGLMQVYPNKRVVGVISKVDLPDADIATAQKLLRENGIAEPYFETSIETGQGIDRLRSYLISLTSGPIESAPVQATALRNRALEKKGALQNSVESARLATAQNR